MSSSPTNAVRSIATFGPVVASSDIIHQILSFTDYHTRRSCLRVNKEWYTVVAPMLFTHLTINPLSKPIPFDALSGYERRQGLSPGEAWSLVRHITIEPHGNCPPVSPEPLGLLISSEHITFELTSKATRCFRGRACRYLSAPLVNKLIIPWTALWIPSWPFPEDNNQGRTGLKTNKLVIALELEDYEGLIGASTSFPPNVPLASRIKEWSYGAQEVIVFLKGLSPACSGHRTSRPDVTKMIDHLAASFLPHPWIKRLTLSTSSVGSMRR